MKTNRRWVVWPSRVPVVDTTFRESVLRATARDPRTWGFFLARLRAARGWSVSTQNTASGLSLDALICLSIWRLPRAELRAEDIARVAKCLGLREQVLHDLLSLASC